MRIYHRILLLLMALQLGNSPIKGDDTRGKFALSHFADVISPRIYSFRPEFLDLKQEVKPFRVYVEWNWYTYQPDKTTRLPVLEAPLQFARYEFLSKEDGTLIITLYAVEELDSEMIPAFVQLKRDRHEQWVFDRYYPKDKAQFKSFMGHQLILNPTLYHFKGSDYYMDPLEMCFFKLEDDSYRWCLDDLPSTTVDDLFKWIKSNTSVINQIVTDQYVELTVGIIQPFERVDMEVCSYQLDLDAQKSFKRNIYSGIKSSLPISSFTNKAGITNYS